MAASSGPPAPEEQRRIVRELDAVPMQAGDQMRLVCAKWWAQWQEHVQYLGESGAAGPPPSPISNRTLLQERGTGSSAPALRDDLQERSDFIIVPASAWDKLVEWYGGGPPLTRTVHLLGEPGAKTLRVEVYPMVLTVLHSKDLTKSSLHSISATATIGELKSELCELFGVAEDDCRLWDYYKGNKYIKLDKMSVNLEDAKLIPRQQIMLEEKENGAYPEGSDEVSSQSMVTGFRDNGSLHSSSSTAVGSNPVRLGYYNSVQDDVTLDPEYRGRKGHAGLQNLGNTCFMNSSLQCLSHTPPLTKYFLSNEHEREINADNVLGLGGELAKAFGSLMHSLWKGSAASVAPRSFKSQLGKFAPNFSGYNQQDSQELLAFLLDGLHEDLNRVKSKPYIELKDGDGRPDDEVAEEAWSYHQARNDSVIVDLFQGQYKSTLVCPTCNASSVKFDPFMYLSLPMPATQRILKITVVNSNGSSLPTTYGVKVNKNAKVMEAMALLRQQIGFDDETERLVVCEVFHHYVYRWLADTTSTSSLKDTDTVLAFRLPKAIDGCSKLRDVVCYQRKAEPSSVVEGSVTHTLCGWPIMVSMPDKLAGGGEEACAAVSAALSIATRPYTRSADVQMTSDEAGSSQKPAFMDMDPPSPAQTSAAPDDAALFELKHSDMQCSNKLSSSYKESQSRPAYSAFSSTTYAPSGVHDTHMADYVAVEWSERACAEMYDLSRMETPMLDPSVTPAKNDGVDLQYCIEGFLQEEPLGPEDMWYCPKCKEHRQATKKLELWRMPEVLVVHLKRFSYSRVWRDKIDTAVSFPLENLDLSPYVQRSEGHKPEYQLFAVSNHYGSLGGGHYTAYARQTDDGKWYLFDDSCVTQVQDSDVCSPAGYCLFYWRKNAAKGSFADLSTAS